MAVIATEAARPVTSRGLRPEQISLVPAPISVVACLQASWLSVQKLTFMLPLAFF